MLDEPTAQKQRFSCYRLLRLSRRFQFHKSHQLFIRTHKETLSAAMRICNPDRSPLESVAETQPQLQPALLRLIRLKIILSGWWGLSPRPVAAATALPWFVELVSTASSFVVPLALRCFGSAGKAFATDQNPWHSMFGRLRLASVVAVNTISQILARPDITSAGFFAA